MTTSTHPSPSPSEIAKAKLYAKLARLGIATVLISYDGCGDSGCIESLEARDRAGQMVQLPDRPVTIELVDTKWNSSKMETERFIVRRKVLVEEAIKSWCYDLLELHFSGWEINEGAQGTIAIDIAKKTATLEHDQNVMTTTTHIVEA